MRTLVLGGIRSGKSAWAEAEMADTADTAGTAGAAIRYLATGPTADSEPTWAARVAAHRDRRPSHWTTVETAEVSALLRDAPAVPTLVDDLGGWLTALLDRHEWADVPVLPEFEALSAAVAAFPAPLVLVSPEVGLSVVPATAAGCRFADELGLLNQLLAKACDRVVLVVAGQPVWVKR